MVDRVLCSDILHSTLLYTVKLCYKVLHRAIQGYTELYSVCAVHCCTVCVLYTVVQCCSLLYSIEGFCAVLHSFIESCAVMYSIVQC